MSDCLFCRIIAGEVPSQKIYEDEHTFVFLDIAPITKGHTLVVPKKHFTNFEETNVEELKQCQATLHKIAPLIKKGVSADGYNVGINNGKAAGQVIMHTHFHIIPRWDDDGLSSWPNQKVTQEELDNVQKDILHVIDK